MSKIEYFKQLEEMRAKEKDKSQASSRNQEKNKNIDPYNDFTSMLHNERKLDELMNKRYGTNRTHQVSQITTLSEDNHYGKIQPHTTSVTVARNLHVVKSLPRMGLTDEKYHSVKSPRRLTKNKSTAMLDDQSTIFLDTGSDYVYGKTPIFHQKSVDFNEE